jgi:hypothetical protein
MDAKLYGVRATQDFVPKTPAEQYEENLVGFYYKLSVMLQEKIIWLLIILFLHGSAGFVWFSLIHC